jgi:hypothetical protein
MVGEILIICNIRPRFARNKKKNSNFANSLQTEQPLFDEEKTVKNDRKENE